MVYAGRTYRKCPLSAPPPSAAADQTPEMVSPALYSYLYPGCRSITIGRWQLVRFQNRHYRRYRKTISVAPAGQRIDITLQDGTSVCLNSGAKLEYPIRFNRNRRVKLSGEAMFNVEHDAAHPFIVETFACDVEVLGTKFNVTADELTHDFTTALLRGKVKVTNKLASGDQIILDPNEKVCLNGKRLVLTRIENTDDYLWTEGILNLVGHPFADIIAKMEKTYGVKIQIQTAELPQIDVIRGKIPVNMGLDYALRALQKITPFQYEKDENNVIHIK